MKLKVFLIIGMFINCFGYSSYSQNNNFDFSLMDFTNWNAYVGSCCPIYANTASNDQSRFTIINTPSFDPYTCSGLQILPAGVNQVARLGNSFIGAEAEKLKYTFNPVTVGNALVFINFAIVLESPNHTCSEQPRFEIRAYNASGTSIDASCDSYSYAAGGCGINQGNFIPCSGVEWQDWKTAFLDLTSFIGQQVTIEFASGDCSLGGHFGYGYLYGKSLSSELDTTYFPAGDSLIITAPSGFSYFWPLTNDTSQSITVINPSLGAVYNCQITSNLNCMIPLSISIGSSTVIDTAVAQFSLASDTVCVGSVLSISNSSAHASSYHWDFGNGDTSNLINPSPIFNSPGTYTISLIASNAQGFVDTFSLQVYAIGHPVANIAVIGDSIVCSGQSINLQASGGTSYTWSNGQLVSTISVVNPGLYAVYVSNLYCSPDTAYYQFDTLSPASDHICLVTVDTLSNKNLIIWEKDTTYPTVGYKIYKETQIGGSFVEIAYIPYSQLSQFEDTASNPFQSSDRYYLSVIDTCGNESLGNITHRTIHLQASLGLNGEINLAWNNYEGFAISTYGIYRSNNGNAFQLINSIAFGNNSYSDLNPPSGNNRYLIIVGNPDGCSAMRSLTNSYSNIIGAGLITGLQNENSGEGLLFPNPTDGLVHFLHSERISQIILHDFTGRLIWTGKPENGSIHLNGLSTGIYTISIREREEWFKVKLVIE